uniref:G_PROTEIN_RECEP_F1_2 domain-containing protein n=1 Tax=Strongyloides papillosus TaxID=174720 RepID=A0A0N5BK98_STREA
STAGYYKFIFCNVFPIVETVGNAISLIFLIIFFKHLIVSNHYHLNIRIFMIGFVIYPLFIIVARFLIFLGLLEGKIFSSTYLGSEKYCMVSFFTLKIGSLGFNSIFYTITAERIIASVRYKTYENEKSAILCIGILLVQYLGIFMTIFVSVDRTPESQNNQLLIPCLVQKINGTAIVVLTYTFYVMNILFSVAYIILIIVNNRLYKRSSSNSLGNILSMKYQILENLQFLKALLPCIIIFLIATIVTTIIVLCYWSLIKKPNRSKEDIFSGIEISQLKDIVFTTSFILIPLITNHKLNKLVRFSRKKRNKILPSNSKCIGHINTIEKSTKLNENEVYFKQFKKQWN